MSTAEKLKYLSAKSFLWSKALEDFTRLVEDPSPRKLKRFLKNYRKAVMA